MKDNWIYASAPGERERLLFMPVNQELFTNIHVYFCSQKKKKHEDNSNHQITLSLLQVRIKLYARKTWVLLRAGLETEYRSFYALKRMMQMHSIEDLFFMGQKKRIRVTLV